ncbi:alpha/beta fold hydrolase [Streptomyces sp. NBRC 109706]|uniref:alpha/beta fold hydrolase n=1 Tax=Streptomyces sp. NBRC 109706 TaxID=1550035 RepID=UPI0022772605|nr:alpha/beta fold hydrolase [Streptomyces sp. NBRC 109706]
MATALTHTRTHHPHRTTLTGTTTHQLLTTLHTYAQGQNPPHTAEGQVTAGRTAFLLPGQGSQRPGMTRQLATAYPVYAEALDAVCAVLDPELPRPLREVLFAEDAADDSVAGAVGNALDETGFAQPALFAVEVALFRLLESWGITPDLLLGHSVGEIAAAHMAGALTLPDAAALVAARGRLMQALPAGGGMLAVQASEDEVRAALAEGPADEHGPVLALAAVNGPSSTVVSGPVAALERFEAPWRAAGRKTRRLRVSHAFHSPRLLRPMLDELATVAQGITVGTPRIPLVSNVTGELWDAETVADPEYWVRHAQQPVRFLAGVRALERGGAVGFLEVGPGGTLSALVRDGLSAPADAVVAAALPARQPEAQALLEALGELYTRGLVELTGLFDPARARAVTLPTYAFQRRRYWLTPDAERPRSTAGAETAPEETPGPVAPGDPLALVSAEVAAVLGFAGDEVVDPERTLLELGVDSMGAVRLQQRLTVATGLDLPPTLLVEHPTPAALAERLRALLGQEAPPPPAVTAGGTFTALLRTAHERGELAGVVPLLAAAAGYRPTFADPAELAGPPASVLVSDGRAEPTLVAVPSFLAGSGPHQFARLAAGFDRRPRMAALNLPGFGPGEAPTPAPDSWRAAVAALAAGTLAAAGDGPPVLVGHSIGGVLAHAVAGALRDAGRPVAGVVLIDTYEPLPAVSAEVFGWAMGHILDRDHAYVDLTDDKVLAMGGYLRLLDGWAADQVPRLDVPTLLLTAERGPEAPAARWPPWRAVDTVTEVPGDHFSLLENDAPGAAAAVEDWLGKETSWHSWA